LIYKGTDDETFCMAVAEAQTHGIPVVVCNFGSLSERVKNYETGFVCDNESEFSVKTIKLLKDDKTWMRMHKNLIKNNNHDDWSEVAKKWQKIID
jgi:glycosyltransferase involved in cell wall biosynthesis